MQPTLKPHWFHILLALSARDLHGSGIVREVLALTDGELRLWPATLYGSLEALTEDGLIGELSSSERPDGESERRRYYGITPVGRRVLSDEAERMARLVAAARERIGESRVGATK